MSTPLPSAAPSPPGRPDEEDCVVKIAASPPGRRRLRHEAAALRHAAHPDVVRLVAFHDLDDHTELRTSREGELTLLDLVPTDGPTAVTLASSLATAVADLHEIGLVHGRLTPDHVVIRTDGRPALCGFSEAGPGNTDVDVLALATLFEMLATAVPRRRSRRNDRAAATLIAAAEHARRTSPTPPARELVRHLAASKAKLCFPRFADVRQRMLTPRTRRTLISVATTAALVLVAVTALRSFGGDARDASVLQATPTTTGVPRTTIAPKTTATSTPTPPSTAASPALTADPVRFDADGASYSVGAEGDIVVVGDWDCDGIPGAALLQPTDGDVYVFDRLASPESPVTGRLVITIRGAIDLESLEQTGGCSTLAVRHADGSPQLVAVGAP